MTAPPRAAEKEQGRARSAIAISVRFFLIVKTL
jgi:hypothetical protein